MTNKGAQFDPEALLGVLDIARQLAAPVSLEELLGHVIDAGRRVLQADRGTVFLYDAANRELYSSVATGAKEIRFSIERGIAGQCARDRQTINVPDCYADPRFNPEVDRRTGYRTRSLITVPLIGLEDELVGVMQLLNPLHKASFEASDVQLAEIVASQAAAAIQRAQLLQTREAKLKLDRDLALARQIQHDVLPARLPMCAGYDLAGFSQPADETGGDLYDVIPQPLPLSPEFPGAGGDDEPAVVAEEGLILFLADATGHGIGPALSVTQVRAMLRIAVRLQVNIDDLILHVNNQLVEDLGSRRFVTAFLGRLDRKSHRVIYHAAGQGPILHFEAATRSTRILGASSLPLGVMADPPMDRPEDIVLAPGDVLALMTDGFYEYLAPDNDMMGKHRMAESLTAHADKSAREILQAILRDTLTFARGEPQADDLTGVIVKRVG